MKKFTVADIEKAHEKVKSGADFPNYIKEIKSLGVIVFETWVVDSHTNYFGTDDFETTSDTQYDDLMIEDDVNIEKFTTYLKIHQKGETDYFTFCKHCAETGIEKWIVSLDNYTCTYFDKNGNTILNEKIPH
ncbi:MULTISPECIES: DUF1398 domain-containing protein [unclassified Empedobacter]|uniref:DUF1398 domain-containing protein n=1 Tax=unclassified Empedobacter TaxID=2643773 RepID=UPI0024482946|nr:MULTISPECIES: DUF1398 family protein [unclassified Empedobacter]MDH2207178.1 DUF1398 domain-containing protein [Empedobacter sp. GD03644]